MKPRLAAFFTGGAISMRFDPATGGAVPALSGKARIKLMLALGAGWSVERIRASFERS